MITLFHGDGLLSDRLRVYLDQLEPTFDQLISKSDIKDGSGNNFTKQTLLLTSVNQQVHLIVIDS